MIMINKALVFAIGLPLLAGCESLERFNVEDMSTAKSKAQPPALCVWASCVANTPHKARNTRHKAKRERRDGDG